MSAATGGDRLRGQVAELQEILERGLRAGVIRRLAGPSPPRWPDGPTHVLARDTALELGGPGGASVGVLLWCRAHGAVPEDGRVLVAGPDIPELAARDGGRGDFGQAVLVRVTGDAPQDYEGYLGLREALSSVSFSGVSLRSLPGSGHLWCRVSRHAVTAGFGLAHMGDAMVRSLHRLPFVERVEVLFHTAGGEGLRSLERIASAVGREVGALIKRHEQDMADCDDCEYQDICDEREHPREEAAP